jgi:hypothetical protein
MKIQKLLLPIAVLVCAAAPLGAATKQPRSGASGQRAEPAATHVVPTLAPPPDPGRDALKKRCADAAKKGETPPEECKTLELEVVFNGGVGPIPGTGEARTVMQARDDEAKLAQQQKAIQRETAEAEPMASAQGSGDALLDLWAQARREPALFDEESPGRFSIGARVGYPFIVANSTALKRGYAPVIHVSAELAFQPFSFLQVALVGDFERLRGDSIATKEHSTSGDAPLYDDGSTRDLRDIGLLLDDQTDIGVRPTVRFVGEWRSIQASLGLGLGWHYLRASGYWRAKVGDIDREGSSSQSTVEAAAWSGDDTAVYSFSLADNGAYAALELAIMYRAFDGRLGMGIMAQYSIPMHGSAVPDVVVEEQYGLDGELDGYHAEADDYEETPVRQLGALSFLSLGLAADYRF